MAFSIVVGVEKLGTVDLVSSLILSVLMFESQFPEC